MSQQQLQAEESLLSDRNSNELLFINLATVMSRMNSIPGLHKCVAVVRHFIMTRLIFTVYILLLLVSTAFGQNSDSSFLVEKFNANFRLVKLELVADSLLNIYKGTSNAELKKIESDTAFVKSIILPGYHGHDQLVCSTYKIPHIIKPLGWTSDYGHIFTDQQIVRLDSTLSNYEKRTGNEIAVVTFDSSFIHEENFDSLVLGIHNLWGVGKIDRHNGILIGISTAKRRIRIDNGSGIVVKLSDKETKAIIDNIVVPEFKQGDYFDGVKNAIEEIMKKL